MSKVSRYCCTLLAGGVFALGYVSALPSAPAAAAEGGAKSAATFEVYKDKAGEFRWRMRAGNGQIIATGGEGYKDKAACVAGIESVKHHAAEAKIVEVEAAK